MRDQHDKFCALLGVLLAGFATMPLFQPYFFASSDGLFHLYRLMEYDVVLRDGVLYPRWAPDFFFGLGMPLFNYYAPLTYYLAEVFHILGAGYIDSLRLLAVAAMALSGFGAYLYARTLLAPMCALLVAVVYMYAPYHIVNLYYRGDLAEYVAYTWFPFILWALARTLSHKSTVHLCAGSFFYAALILTHNLSAFIFSGFLVLYAAGALVRRYSSERNWRANVPGDLLRLVAITLGGAGLSTFFWLPALAEKSLVDFDRLLDHYNFHEHFPTIEELLSTDVFHRYGVVFRGSEVYGYRLGLFQAVFLALGAVLLLWRLRRCKPDLRIEAIVSLLVSGTALFLIFPVSTWLWEEAPLLNLAQFPWRFLAFVALPGALLAGTAVELLPRRGHRAAVMVLVPLVIASSVAGASPIMSNVKEADVSPKGSMEFELVYGAIGTSAAAEYLPRWVKERPATSAPAMTAVLDQQVGTPVGRTAPGMHAVQVEKSANRGRYQVRSEKAGPFVPNVLFFPGWVALVDGKAVDVGVDDPSGLVEIQVPEGEHTIDLRFVETPMRKASDAVSVLALLALLGSVVASARPWRWRGVPIPALRLGRANAAKAGLVVALALVWLFAKSAYEAAYALPTTHQSPLVMNLEDEVLIEGYDLSGVEPTSTSSVRVQPGLTMNVTIFWRRIGDGTKDYRPFVRLTNSFKQTWAYSELPSEHTAANTRRGEATATTFDLTVPYGTPPGVYEIEVGFESASEKRLLEVRRVQLAPIMPGEKGARIGPIILKKQDSSFTRPAEGSSVPQTNFGDSLRLLTLSIADGEALISGRPGASLATDPASGDWRIRAGEVVHLDLLWQAMGKLGGDFKVTARLVGADRALWAVRDSPPADGAYPTSFWSDGEVVRDQLNLKVPPETPPGRYELQLEVISRSGPLSILDDHHSPIGPTLRAGGIVVSPSAKPADPNQVKIQRRVDAPILYGLSIVGYSVGRTEVQPGEQLRVDLVWMATKAIGADVVMRLDLVDMTGKARARDSRRPVGDAYPTSVWREGEVLKGQYNLTLEAAAPAGDADLTVLLADASSGESLAQMKLDRVRVTPRTRSFSASPSRRLTKEFDGKIRLLGFDTASGTSRFVNDTPRLAPGETLLVTLYWQALAEMGTGYTVFAQVLDASGRLVAQHDAPPQGGKEPTTAWVRDEVVADGHSIDIPMSLGAGDYTLIVGLYDAATGKRLPIEGGGDFVVLTNLQLANDATK